MIPIVFISDNNFIMQTHVAILSLIENKNFETEYDIYIIMADCAETKKSELEVLSNEQVFIHFIDVSLDEFRDIKQLSHIPIACLLKFKICDLVEKYDKLLYLDGDVIVRGDLSELYRLELNDCYASAVPSIWNIYNGGENIDAGIMLFDAKKMRENHLSQKLIACRRSLGDRGSMDQQSFNIILKDKITPMPCEYNCVASRLIGEGKKLFPIQKVNELYHANYTSNKDVVNNAIIIHYATGGKPWKYTYVACANEWYFFYKKSIYGKIGLKRDTRISAHMKGFIRVLKNKGVKGVCDRVRSYTIDRNKQSNIDNNWG